MPKIISSDDLNVVASVIARHDGASITDLEQSLAGLPRRTLHRRLATLIANGRITTTGRGRALRYRLAIRPFSPDKVLPASPYFAVRETPESYIPIAADADAIKQAVRKPTQERSPVGYNRAFLDDYRPNETFYLPLETRQRLFQLGRTHSDHPAGTYARQIMQRLLIDLSWNSSRLEGNTYSLLETERLFKLGEGAEGKNAVETQMILNHKAAIEFIVESAEEMQFDSYTILNLHALLSDNLLHDPRASGRIREIPVGIAHSTYLPLNVPQLIGECFQTLLAKANVIRDPFEQAFFAMVHLPYLQPFEDVNKRVSRLAANIPLVRNNLCPLSFIDVPQRAYIDGLLGVYEHNCIELLRDVFVWAYDRSSGRYSEARQVLGQPNEFRMHYRTAIAEVLAELVHQRLDKQAAVALIKRRAKECASAEDEARFVEVVETEAMSLHNGNIARFKIRPSEFDAWQKNWR